MGRTRREYSRTEPSGNLTFSMDLPVTVFEFREPVAKPRPACVDTKDAVPSAEVRGASSLLPQSIDSKQLGANRGPGERMKRPLTPGPRQVRFVDSALAALEASSVGHLSQE